MKSHHHLDYRNTTVHDTPYATSCIRYGVLLAASLLSSSVVFADTDLAQNFSPTINLSGFGTAAADLDKYKGANWTSTTEEYSGPGKDRTIDTGVDSIFGVQLDNSLTRSIHETVQVVSRRLSNGQADPYFEWANIQLKVYPNWMVRLGRLANNTFLYSDSRDIGYDRPTIHLPDLYLMNPTSNINGGDIGFRHMFGSWNFHSNVNYGVFNQEYINNSINGHVRSAGINVGLDRDSQSFRISYAQGNVDLQGMGLSSYHQSLTDLNQVMSVTGYSPQLVRQTSDVLGVTNTQGIHASFFNASYTYDDSIHFLTAEYAERHMSTLIDIPNENGFYVNAGVHLNKWSPYVQYSQNKIRVSPVVPALSENGVNVAAPLYTIISALNAASSSFSGSLNERTVSTGVRWDIQNNFDFKVQYDLILKPANSYGVFVGSIPSFFNSAQKVSLYSAALDFIF